jgi:hypothetical protein
MACDRGRFIIEPNPLIGAWHLLRWDITYADGRAASLPYGADATGLLLYTPDGWMSASISRAVRPSLSSASVRSAPEVERLAAFESCFTYAGPYRLRQQGGKMQVVHTVMQALNPNFVGTEQVRDMSFDAQARLTLSASDTLPGSAVARHHRLQWERRDAGADAPGAT